MNAYEIGSLIIGGMGVVLTGMYVLLTLRIANKTAESVKATQTSLALAQDQLEINKQQSKDATLLSEKQARETIQAVHDQIQASEQQHRQQMENQYKPFLIPTSRLASAHATTFITITNQGAGVALNVWGLFTMRNFPPVYSCKGAYVVMPTKDITCEFANSDVFYQQGMFAGYPLVLKGSESGIKEILRLMLTYSDIFNNNFLVIFDYNEQFGWQLVAFQKVVKRLDELAVKQQ